MGDTTKNFLEVAVNPPNAELDIVAVHGLHPFGSGSNAFSTWTAAQGKEERNWLIHPEFLPALVPTARIMIFGYNSNAVFSASEGTVSDHALNLIELLRQKRRRESPKRPIVFICHSLGGLLVKRSICMAYNSDRYKIIYTSTKGIIFFATPQGGGQNVSVGNLAASIFRTITNNPDNAYMEALKKNSLCSQNNRDDFLQRSGDFAFVSIIESLKTKGAAIVRKEDSILGLPLDRERRILTDANHTDICKFWDPSGRAFDLVKESISEIAEDAIESAAAAVVPAPPAANQIVLVPYLENTTFRGREEHLKQIHENFTAQPRYARSQRRAILQGYPGIGKTTIALQYSIQHGEIYDGIFWISAISSDVIEREYAKIEEEMKRRTSQGFRDWCSSKKWLLIIDNLDDPKCFNAQAMIPQGQGDIIITSRRTDFGDIGKAIPIPPLDVECASKVLLLYAKNRLCETEDVVNALKLVKLLGCVPLAIRHCGSLVSAQGTKLSSYMREFDDLMTELVLPEESQKDTFSLNENKALLGTFDISFDHLQQGTGGEEAAALLSLMANLELINIPLTLLERSLESHKRWGPDGNAVMSLIPGMPEWLEKLPSSAHGRGIRETLKTLVKYSLIFLGADQRSYFLHPITHFWLRWKQDAAKDPQPFRDALAILSNGFPHPDFSRIYGISHRHKMLRLTYMPYVQYVQKRYLKLKAILVNNVELLLQLAELFLMASEVPLEHRPMKQRVRVNIPGTDIPMPNGSLVDPFEQDVTFLESVKDIIVQLDYPGILYLRAVYVFFEHTCKEWRAARPVTGYRVQDITFAGRSLVQAREALLARFPDSRDNASEGDEWSYAVEHIDGQVDVADLKPLMPLLADPGDSLVENKTLDVASGMMGLIALKYTHHVRESVFEMGGNFNIDPVTQAIQFVLDNRAWVPGFASMQWIRHFRSMLYENRERLCDFTRFAHHQLVLQAYQSKNDTGELRPLWPLLRLWSGAAVAGLVNLAGPESVFGAESLFLLMWDGTHWYPAQTWIPDDDVYAILDTPITADNYYFKIKLIDAWIHSLRARDMLHHAERVIVRWLEKFLACDRTLMSRWDFGLDPILDLYEFAIYLYQAWTEDSVKALEFQARYLDYFENEYGTMVERLCLGCGVGVFGLRHARLRVSRLWQGDEREKPEISPGRVLEIMFFEKLKEKLGASGSVLPNDDPNTGRLTEQEWCRCRQFAYLDMTGLEMGKMPVTFGKALWSDTYPKDTTVDDTLFQAEAENVKKLTQEAIEEFGAELTRLMEPDANVQTSEASSSVYASMNAPADASADALMNASMNASASSTPRKESKVTKLMQRLRISRKGKERAHD
ncbi:hypothetical protein ONS95_013340 [Cadophora gregata]|uniref:uncharacterized protein n=1 Tax=Cadophora gregata TaxID=51156 RepID=UPI0026DC3D94|nr:uncharacterized protein ONS95_013340 [Cadophora gregata]KAK0099769.1 hypothetical protein ONS96_008265 [Cadophora gregata f. sp. sojae]KAK0116319.1 hypothetical protein ONS95_013340 [Cadophora gregata]